MCSCPHLVAGVAHCDAPLLGLACLFIGCGRGVVAAAAVLVTASLWLEQRR
jgi:hypothetical protein